MLPDVFADATGLLALALLVAALIGGGLLLHNSLGPRRAAWIAVALAGLPALAIWSVAYLIGPLVAFAVFGLAAMMARWRELDHVVPSLLVVLHVLIFGLLIIDERGASLTAGLILYGSAFAALIASAKLGRIFGRKVLWREEAVEDAEAAIPTQPVLPGHVRARR